jgi:hypothetical protein
MVQQLGLKTKDLQKPRKVHNVDRTPNRAGEIRQACKMTIYYQEKKSRHNFFLTNISIDDIILGYPSFEDLLPDIDWKQGKVIGNISLEMDDASRWTPPSHQ